MFAIFGPSDAEELSEIESVEFFKPNSKEASAVVIRVRLKSREYRLYILGSSQSKDEARRDAG